MVIFVIMNIDENIVWINNNENIKLLNKDLINIFLEAYLIICQSKSHHFVLKVAVLSPK